MQKLTEIKNNIFTTKLIDIILPKGVLFNNKSNEIYSLKMITKS